ncbi:45930_t:CDS:2 [Gigaspora margarita]|uniref:45930_t:CDS:1 n=2 Tax=Gigasporaceae TaxID=36753 RepID=A0ABN7V0V9_GIGMA|nr:45930_t:CDS:2 [Gigaspora margarita]
MVFEVDKFFHTEGETVALAVVIVESLYIRGLKFEVDIVEALRSIGAKVIHRGTKQPKGTIGIVVGPTMGNFTPGAINTVLEIAEPPKPSESLEQLPTYPIIVTDKAWLPKYLINAALRELNSDLIQQIAELRKKYTEVEAENAKLKQIIEENGKRDVRVEELEQKNIELETRLAILEQEKEEKSISTEDVSHSPVKSNDTLKQIVPQCGDTPVSDITDDTSEQTVLQNKDAPASDVSNNVSNSDEYQSRVSNSYSTELSAELARPIYVKPKSSEDKEIDDFLVERHNEQVRIGIIERNREKKLQRESPIENSSKEDIYMSNIKSSISPEQKKEQGLIQEISTSIKDQSQATEISANNLPKMFAKNHVTKNLIQEKFTDNSSDDLIETEINEEAKRISSETEDVKSLPETEVSISAKSISKEPETVNVFDKYNENDGEFSDDNDDEFSDDNDDGDYCGFSDEDEPGYYYDLSSGKKTYKNSDYLISAY